MTSIVRPRCAVVKLAANPAGPSATFSERCLQTGPRPTPGRIPRKPDPAGAIEIATALAVPVDQFIYVGDSTIDMETARRAGMIPVGVAWGFQSRTDLDQNGAPTLIERPLELLDI